MSRLEGRIKKLEERGGEKPPCMLIAHSGTREEADELLREFRKKYPHAPPHPVVLIPEPIEKLPKEGRQNWSQDPRQSKKS